MTNGECALEPGLGGARKQLRIVWIVYTKSRVTAGPRKQESPLLCPNRIFDARLASARDNFLMVAVPLGNDVLPPSALSSGTVFASWTED